MRVRDAGTQFAWQVPVQWRQCCCTIGAAAAFEGLDRGDVFALMRLPASLFEEVSYEMFVL